MPRLLFEVLSANLGGVTVVSATVTPGCSASPLADRSPSRENTRPEDRRAVAANIACCRMASFVC